MGRQMGRESQSDKGAKLAPTENVRTPENLTSREGDTRMGVPHGRSGVSCRFARTDEPLVSAWTFICYCGLGVKNLPVLSLADCEDVSRDPSAPERVRDLSGNGDSEDEPDGQRIHEALVDAGLTDGNLGIALGLGAHLNEEQRAVAGVERIVLLA